MTRNKFLNKFTKFLQYAAELNEMARKCGVSSLENELENIDDDYFREGLGLVIDEAEPVLIDEILSYNIKSEKNKYMRLYRTIQKRAVLGIQSGFNTKILVLVLFSCAGLKQEEKKKIESLLMKEPHEPAGPEEFEADDDEDNASITAKYEFNSIRDWSMTVQDIEHTIGKMPVGIKFSNAPKREITIKENCGNREKVEQIIRRNGGIPVDLDDLEITT